MVEPLKEDEDLTFCKNCRLAKRQHNGTACLFVPGSHFEILKGCEDCDNGVGESYHNGDLYDCSCAVGTLRKAAVSAYWKSVRQH